jgi:hypothetical protein
MRSSVLALTIYTQSGHQGTETFGGVQPPQHRPFRACSLLSRFMARRLTCLIWQLGVSIPEDTRVTPVMIVSELCSNGDLFDYVRNVVPPSLYRVVRPIAPAAYTNPKL